VTPTGLPKASANPGGRSAAGRGRGPGPCSRGPLLAMLPLLNDDNCVEPGLVLREDSAKLNPEARPPKPPRLKSMSALALAHGPSTPALRRGPRRTMPPEALLAMPLAPLPSAANNMSVEKPPEACCASAMGSTRPSPGEGRSKKWSKEKSSITGLLLLTSSSLSRALRSAGSARCPAFSSTPRPVRSPGGPPP